MEKALVVIMEHLVYDECRKREHKPKQLINGIYIMHIYAIIVALQRVIENSHRAADMSLLIQYAVVSMISGSVVALISIVVILGILMYRYRKHRMLPEKGSMKSEALLNTKLDDA